MMDTAGEITLLKRILNIGNELAESNSMIEKFREELSRKTARVAELEAECERLRNLYAIATQQDTFARTALKEQTSRVRDVARRINGINACVPWIRQELDKAIGGEN